MSFIKNTLSPCRILICLASLSFASQLNAALRLNAAREITHQVFVHPIRTFTTDGSTGATFFGDASEKADIIDKINQIWAQAGIEIIFLPENQYNDTFTYNNFGNNPGGVRPFGHFEQFFADEDAPMTPSTTDIEMFFVRFVPGAPEQFQFGDSVFGLARLDRPGAAIFVGENLLNGAGGREIIAAVVAHEIGHCLGLPHRAAGATNVMAESNRTGEQLDNTQFNTVFTNNSGLDGFDLLFPIPTLSGYELFADENDLQLGPEGDDDGDTLSNVLEFAIGTNPRTPSSLPLPIKTSSTTGRWTIPKNPDAVDDDVTYTVLVSSDLSTFRPAGTAGSSSQIVTDSSSTLSVNLQGPGPFFVALEVELP